MNVTLDQIQNLSEEDKEKYARYVAKSLARQRARAKNQYEQEQERKTKCRM